MNDLPEVFASLLSRVSYVAKITDNEYHSSCPQCGGTVHEDGSYPNRFVMWIVSRYGNSFGLCRKCGYKWTPGKEDAHWTPRERLQFKIKARQLEIEYLRRKSVELEELSKKIHEQGFYRDYCEAAKADKRVMAYFESIGVPADWVEYLQWGYIPDFKVTGRNSSYRDSAFTFPVWSMKRIENIKVRVEHPINKEDRYRNIYKSGCQHLYTPVHESDKLACQVVVAEGEKKAAVIQIHGGLASDVQVVGLQSVTPEKRIVDILKHSNTDVFYLALDPDAYVKDSNGVASVLKLAKDIGEDRCRLVLPPRDTKFDDAINLGFMFRNAFNMAIKPEKL